MEALNQKSLERAVSQRALQMGSSFPCQICVMGFLCGVCLTSLFLATLTSFGSFEFGGISFSSISMGTTPGNSSSEVINAVTSTDCKFMLKETERWVDSHRSEREAEDQKVSLLYSAWGALVTNSVIEEREFLERFRLKRFSVPNAPHFEDCKLSTRVNTHLDTRSENGDFPPWTSWKGLLDMYPVSSVDEQIKHFRHQAILEGIYPPWISGSDEENYPLTRKVQRDLWVHQHPSNCSDPNVRFLVADWERLPGFGIGAQIAGMCGLLAIAINEKRILVTNYFNRADHDGCKGSSRSSWSCYFFPEASQECRDRAFELMGGKEAWEKGIITTKDNYTSKEIWAGRTPREWGDPWSYLQPTTEINGSLIAYHRKMDRRWWRAQAVRYLMRFQSDYMCVLMNDARHAAFGKEAAKVVLASLPKEWPKVEVTSNSRTDIEEFVWSSHRPWIPRPLLSMHVRMGDKACEMKVVEFEEYVHLAGRVRKHFPHLNSIWLSTEMQKIVDKTKQYPHWNFYYTNVTRQVGNITMAKYEASLGRKTSTNYPLVNFLMATEADFFIGALGSTWCFLIDGMRNTGGKVMAGYLSVNKDRFW
ncbi:uncharacterized protein LOC123220475 [Mangifera indica]|uniref:uncharacterized protein LOC123220475 n=1 Tax=Mangifera indica TaxID=29780 RepID=UPI001CFAC495|nr:uncharacterized protein LOC123220475 [Mangifera indica]XP_044498641.1 uncharacterized protein LOC123220475 [Mangifera indica]XP_044498642.1 uncharacterized protein LOC123220475 [Mangifera indica]XP_044498643.1 uncharacterized protein LOC123220475 [Mangifera indica]XP_044498644.1 uncharacterized protein LOC123220475 [Mangifera indica]